MRCRTESVSTAEAKQNSLDGKLQRLLARDKSLPVKLAGQHMLKFWAASQLVSSISLFHVLNWTSFLSIHCFFIAFWVICILITRYQSGRAAWHISIANENCSWSSRWGAFLLRHHGRDRGRWPHVWFQWMHHTPPMFFIALVFGLLGWCACCFFCWILLGESSLAVVHLHACLWGFPRVRLGFCPTGCLRSLSMRIWLCTFRVMQLEASQEDNEQRERWRPKNRFSLA